jgi:NAD(P)-dependent dehydrogenase (short-subunit alcohol dehydrogenase family)
VALITGGNSGIGFEISKALSRRGASVTLACRSPQRCFKAVDAIRSDKLYSGAPVSPLIMDMSKLIKVQHSAKTFIHNNDKLDMLFLNAGIFQDESNPISDDGIETTFATNVVGHHLLYRLLEPLLTNSTMARVVSTSSLAGMQFPFVPIRETEIEITTSVQELNDWKPAIVFNWRPDFIQPFFKYGRSKLAQVLWSKALTRRLGKDSSIYVNAANPGAVKTPMTTHKYAHPMTPKVVLDFYTFLVSSLVWTSEEAALTELYLGVATDEIQEKQLRGKYFHPQSVEVINPYAENEELQENVWQLCEGLVEKFL